ncbi:phosphoglycerate dehydrogenase [Candidatus Omnitrophota bacterium]
MKLLISDSLSEKGIEILKGVQDLQVDVNTGLKPEELKKIIKDYDAIVVRSATKLTADVLQEATKLKYIGRAGVGLDNVDVATATKQGIIVMNAPGGNTISTAEHTVSMILALSRNIPQANASTKKGEWKRKQFMGAEVYGKILGIIGLGKIGAEVAKRAVAFGMKIIAYDPFISLEVAKQLGVEIVELKDLFPRADYITVHTPLSDETKHMISDKQFALMKDGVKVINCARGGIVDEAALVKALESGKVAGCAMDVFETEPPENSPLLTFDNVVVTPHLGASTEEAQVNVAIEIAKTLKDALTGNGIRNAANYPCVEPEVYETLSPYINLSEKMGSFACQLFEDRIKTVDITYSGQISELKTEPITIAVIKGILAPIVQEMVNYVNALSLAKERGIKVQVSKSITEEEFVNLVSVKITAGKKSLFVCGTLSSNSQPRIVKINEFYVEARPEGHMLLIRNADRPGVIGSIGTMLGKNNINIATMTFGRTELGGESLSVVNVDSPISAKILEQIRKAKDIISAKVITL